MKIVLLLVLVCGSVLTSGLASGKIEVRIDVIAHPGRSDATVSPIYLRQEKNAFFCRTDDIPEHEIRIRGLSLKPPFKRQRVEEGCLKAVRWNGAEMCFRGADSANKILNELFRKCFGF